MILKNNATKVLNETKVVDISGSPITSYNGEYMIPVEKIGDILETEVVQNGGSYTVTWRDKSTVISAEDCTKIDGVTMTSVEKLLDEIGREYVKEENKDLLIVGNIVTMNNTKILNKISALIDLLETIGNKIDVVY